MMHPLSDLDGKRKYVFSKDGEDFFLRVVTTNYEMSNTEMLHMHLVKSSTILQ